MTSEKTTRLELPLLAAGQAQKEMTHNEALAVLDLLVQPVVEAVGVDTPPPVPATGRCWIVGAAPTGDWAGQAGAIAGWTAAGWRFATARDGMAVWRRTDGAVARRTATGWTVGEVAADRVLVAGVQVVGARRAAIDDPSGGAVVDAQARDTLAAVLTALRDHGLIAT